MTVNGSLSVTSGIILPTTYSGTPTAGFIGSVVSGTITATTLTTPTVLSISSIPLTPGVWSVSASVYYRALSGTVSTVTCVGCSISTANNTADSIYNTVVACNGYAFGTSGKTFLNVPCTRFVSLTANQTFYLSAFCDGTGSLTAGTNSFITALRIA